MVPFETVWESGAFGTTVETYRPNPLKSVSKDFNKATENEGSRDYSGVNVALDHLQEQMISLRTVQAPHEEHLDQTTQRAHSMKTEFHKLEGRIAAVEEYLRDNGHRWQPQRFESDEA